MVELKEIEQAGEFYEGLPEKEKNELTEAIAEDIFFLDEDMQLEIAALLSRVAPELGEAVKSRNDFTM